MSKTWACIKNAVLAIGWLYFIYRAGVAADAGNTADVIFCLFIVWLIAREQELNMGWYCSEYKCPEYDDDRCCYTCEDKDACTHDVDEACKTEDNSCGYVIKD